MSGEQTTPDGQRQEEPENGGGAPPDPGQEPGNEQGGGEVAKLRKEAAKYRTRLREVEAERDLAVKQATTMARAELRRAFAEHLADPEDVLGGIEDEQVADFFKNQGLDAAAVKSKADEAIAAKPHWRKQPKPDFGGGARPLEPPSAPSFGEAVKQAGSG